MIKIFTKRTISIGLIISLVVIGLAYAGLNWLVSQYFTVGGIEKQISTRLGRPVSLQNFSVSWQGKIVLSELKIGTKKSAQELFLSAEDIAFQPSYWDLLFGRIVLYGANITEPTIQLTRTTNGEWNELINFNQSSSPSSTDTDPSTSSGRTQSVALKNLTLSDGLIKIDDQKVNKVHSITFKNLEIWNFAIGDGAEFQFREISLENDSVSGRGLFDLQTNTVNFDQLDIENLNLSQIDPYVKIRNSKFRIKSGVLDGQLKSLKAGMDKVRANGSISIEKIDATIADEQSIPFNSVEYTGSFETSFPIKSVDFVSSRIGIDDVTLDGSATLSIAPPFNNPDLSGNFKFNKIPLGNLMNLVQQTNTMNFSEYEVDGAITQTDLTLDGTPKQPSLDGTVNLKNVEVVHPRYGPVPPIQSGTIEFSQKQTVTISAESNAFNGSLSAKGNVLKAFESDRNFNFTLVGKSLRIEPLIKTARERGRFDFPPIKATGRIPRTTANISGSLTDLRYDVNGTITETKLFYGKLPEPVRNIRGSFQYQKGTLEVVDMKGTYRDEPVSVTGSLPVPFSEKVPISLRADASNLPVEEILSVVPTVKLPADMNLSGNISLNSFGMNGSISNPTLNGRLEFSNGKAILPFVTDPLTNITGAIQFDGSKGHLKDVNSQFLTRKIETSGSIEIGSSNRLNLNIQTDSFEVPRLLTQFDNLPSFPSGWEPDGTLQIDGSVHGKITNPAVEGKINAPRLSLGKLQGENARGSVRIIDKQLTANPLKMDVYGGTLNGHANFDFTGNQSKTSMSYTVSKINPGKLLSEFSSVGKSSGGDLSGEISFDGPVGNFKKLSGLVSLKGNNLYFKDLKIFNQINQIFNLGLGQATKDQFGILLKKFLDTSETGSKANRLLSSEASTKFDFATGSAKITNGTGQIQDLMLKNDKIKTEVDGQFGLDQSIDLTLHLKPKQGLLKKVDQKWLRNALTDELPPLSVTGTFLNPQFKRDQFSSDLVKHIAQYKVKDELQQKLGDDADRIFKDLLKQ